MKKIPNPLAAEGEDQGGDRVHEAHALDDPVERDDEDLDGKDHRGDYQGERDVLAPGTPSAAKA